jgi:hypothetical protein
MTFEAATERMFSAIQSRDFNALGRALRARAEAIEAGFKPTAETIEEGERALLALAALRRGLALEISRLRQLAPPPRPRVDYWL